MGTTNERPGEPTPGELHAEVARLRDALEDIVTLAHSNIDARQRLTKMERRAIAALSGAGSE